MRKPLAESAEIVLTGVFDRDMWRDIGTGAIGMLGLMLRAIFLLTLPISIPLIALLIAKVRADRARQEIAFAKKVREQYTQAYPETYEQPKAKP